MKSRVSVIIFNILFPATCKFFLLAFNALFDVTRPNINLQKKDDFRHVRFLVL